MAGLDRLKMAETLLVDIFIFLFGLSVGSFLNVLIYRLPASLPLTGRSFCPNCKKKISWYDNIPLLSFFLLGGKCRFCHSPISLQYPLVELATGTLFLLVAYFYWGVLGSWGVLGYWVIISVLVAIFVIDLKYQVVPDLLIFPAIPVALLLSQDLLSSLLSACGASLFFLVLHFLTRGRGMGLGDVKLVFLMGIILGFPKIILGLYAAFLTGALVGVILILAGKKKFGQHLPFGPFLVGSTLFSLIVNEEIMKWLTAQLF